MDQEPIFVQFCPEDLKKGEVCAVESRESLTSGDSESLCWARRRPGVGKESWRKPAVRITQCLWQLKWWQLLISGSHLRPAESDSLEVEPQCLCFQQALKGVLINPEFERHTGLWGPQASEDEGKMVHPPCETAWRHSFPWDWNFLRLSEWFWYRWSVDTLGKCGLYSDSTKHVGFGARFYILLYISHCTFGKLVNLSMPQFTHLEKWG